MELARRFCGAPRRGIEIGASAANRFDGLRAWNVDLPDADVFQRAQLVRAGVVAALDVGASGERLPFADGSVDFVLASHVIEHMPDTLRALRDWDRVVRPGGVIFLIVPHKERTFDRDRLRTCLEHHLADYAERASVESSSLVPTSHYHVWITADLLALVDRLRAQRFLDWEIEAVEDVDSKAGNGFTIVARKRSRTPEPEAGPPGPVAFHHLTLDLPFQVVGRDIEHILPGETLVMPDGLPRGRYRVVPIHASFPPVAGARRTVDVGEPLPPPVLLRADRVDGALRFSGEHLAASTWLESRLPDGRLARLLPAFDAGTLVVPLAGLDLPPELAVRAVNPPPAGGAGAVLSIRFS